MQVTIDIPERLVPHLQRLVEHCNGNDFDATTHGRLTLESLISMLVEDLSLVQSRPGCWEADNMENVLSSHGYEIP